MSLISLAASRIKNSEYYNVDREGFVDRRSNPRIVRSPSFHVFDPILLSQVPSTITPLALTQVPSDTSFSSSVSSSSSTLQASHYVHFVDSAASFEDLVSSVSSDYFSPFSDISPDVG